MRMLIRRLDRSVRPAMLLSTAQNRIRAAVPGCDDAREFQWANGEWLSESGEAVRIDFDPAAEDFNRTLCSEEMDSRAAARPHGGAYWRAAATRPRLSVN